MALAEIKQETGAEQGGNAGKLQSCKAHQVTNDALAWPTRLQYSPFKYFRPTYTLDFN
jgi:hypothetical protein